MQIPRSLIRNARLISRFNSTSAGGPSTTSSNTPKPQSSQTISGVNPNVPGLSKRIIIPKSGTLGPGASHSGEYKVPEYFCYDRVSYHEAEIELAKYRLPQPSART